jgi:DOPA 4,5-dioxygenase
VQALQLRLDTLSRFPSLTVNRPYRNPIGPHPTSMWSAELHTPDQFSSFMAWLCTANEGLSVLVHPNTGDAYADHSVNCYWLGPPLDLNIEIMRPSAKL